jgi:hypothetical protein
MREPDSSQAIPLLFDSTSFGIQFIVGDGCRLEMKAAEAGWTGIFSTGTWVECPHGSRITLDPKEWIKTGS